MRKPILFLAFLTLATACSPKSETGQGGGMAVYEDPQKRFSCKVPGDWRVREEEPGSVAFFGPPSGSLAFAARVSIDFYARAGSEFASPEKFAQAQVASGAKTTPLLEKTWKGRKAYSFSLVRQLNFQHGGERIRQERREEILLIPVSDGFFAIEHSASPQAQESTAPVFQAVVESFLPST
ncbi:MAG: hypothetical protein HY924_08445 [Elusimicrobia bacterium]|nr:hypothetical protein [Elusimicrobiota bacterium]